MNVTFNSVAFIAPPTYKSLSTVKSPSIDDEVLTTNPKFGEIDVDMSSMPKSLRTN